MKKDIRCPICAKFVKVCGCVSEESADCLYTDFTFPPYAEHECKEFVERSGISVYELAMSDSEHRDAFEAAVRQFGFDKDKRALAFFIETLKNADANGISGKAAS